jgi:hypothetical protein
MEGLGDLKWHDVHGPALGPRNPAGRRRISSPVKGLLLLLLYYVRRLRATVRTTAQTSQLLAVSRRIDRFFFLFTSMAIFNCTSALAFFFFFSSSGGLEKEDFPACFFLKEQWTTWVGLLHLERNASPALSLS